MKSRAYAVSQDQPTSSDNEGSPSAVKVAVVVLLLAPARPAKGYTKCRCKMPQNRRKRAGVQSRGIINGQLCAAKAGRLSRWSDRATPRRAVRFDRLVFASEAIYYTILRWPELWFMCVPAPDTNVMASTRNKTQEPLSRNQQGVFLAWLSIVASTPQRLGRWLSETEAADQPDLTGRFASWARNRDFGERQPENFLLGRSYFGTKTAPVRQAWIISFMTPDGLVTAVTEIADSIVSSKRVMRWELAVWDPVLPIVKSAQAAPDTVGREKYSVETSIREKRFKVIGQKSSSQTLMAWSDLKHETAGASPERTDRPGVEWSFDGGTLAARQRSQSRTLGKSRNIAEAVRAVRSSIHTLITAVFYWNHFAYGEGTGRKGDNSERISRTPVVYPEPLPAAPGAARHQETAAQHRSGIFTVETTVFMNFDTPRRKSHRQREQRVLAPTTPSLVAMLGRCPRCRRHRAWMQSPGDAGLVGPQPVSRPDSPP
ncbi:hypothetical protein QBC40DRAFT_321571 [Triangularia verruculosa]|uniref:Uncharacterized protein n=1 Tax=Triangularia verruculosa TaxID=2587418 RepID=A0AAN7APB5_9PEZI|nr:hypothetical protein QBC40DRAFT_321571 [Triangularia verruculosa]